MLHMIFGVRKLALGPRPAFWLHNPFPQLQNSNNSEGKDDDRLTYSQPQDLIKIMYLSTF